MLVTTWPFTHTISQPIWNKFMSKTTSCMSPQDSHFIQKWSQGFLNVNLLLRPEQAAFQSSMDSLLSRDLVGHFSHTLRSPPVELQPCMWPMTQRYLCVTHTARRAASHWDRGMHAACWGTAVGFYVKYLCSIKSKTWQLFQQSLRSFCVFCMQWQGNLHNNNYSRKNNLKNINLSLFLFQIFIPI